MQEIYKRIEDWCGPADPLPRGSGGRVFVIEVETPNRVPAAFLKGCETVGIPTFADMNGEIKEAPGGGAPSNVCIRKGCG